MMLVVEVSMESSRLGTDTAFDVENDPDQQRGFWIRKAGYPTRLGANGQE